MTVLGHSIVSGICRPVLYLLPLTVCIFGLKYAGAPFYLLFRGFGVTGLSGFHM
jgi:hypothetical protein